ncbi:DUF1178 family protein [Rhodospira trueperi]|uniref:Uncharacterized protein n=1 Tax=Rhodospira trueperi TaxID=69960 RepID=A0A1G6YRH9_9PROT|nr:DUF1178 family protein [Rhodospira trueperi]SDD92968.1 hypothetical protein SAMN05421720_102104 [Rhodospira trueperi]
MILYALHCDNGHTFEAWFRDGASFDEQAEAGVIACPECGSTAVGKAIMAPNLARHHGARQSAPSRPSPAPADAPAQGTAHGTAHGTGGKNAPTDSEAASGAGDSQTPAGAPAALSALREMVEKTCDHVGDRFAEEARRIHYGEVAPRSIYGRTTEDEAEALREEGVEFASLPWSRRSDA